MKRGVLAIFGSMNSQTANTLITFTNAYHLPFITWSYPVYTANMNVNNHPGHNYQLYMHPDMASVLIATLKYYKWKIVYYLYNHDDGTSISPPPLHTHSFFVVYLFFIVAGPS